MNKLTVSASPHKHSEHTTRSIMLDVIIALLPAAVMSVIRFGYRAAVLMVVCIAACVISEFIARKIMKRNNTVADLSAVVTGLLLALNLPSTLPYWMAVLGSIIAIVVVKQFFGGLGQNFVNPALSARIILMLCFASAMTAWTNPVDATTCASPLASLKDLSSADTSALPSLWQMLIGLRAGSMGEVCALALIPGGIYLVLRRVITPTIPLAFIGTVFVCMLFATKFDLTLTAYELLSGGLLLGAIFMATDYATSPLTPSGKLIFGVGCGLLTSCIRLFGSLPEGVSYSIILMNILTPHIDSLTQRKPFGRQKEAKQ